MPALVGAMSTCISMNSSLPMGWTDGRHSFLAASSAHIDQLAIDDINDAATCRRGWRSTNLEWVDRCENTATDLTLAPLFDACRILPRANVVGGRQVSTPIVNGRTFADIQTRWTSTGIDDSVLLEELALGRALRWRQHRSAFAPRRGDTPPNTPPAARDRGARTPQIASTSPSALATRALEPSLTTSTIGPWSFSLDGDGRRPAAPGR